MYCNCNCYLCTVLYVLSLDGALMANNPTAVALHEAKNLYPNVPVELVVSLGTGETRLYCISLYVYIHITVYIPISHYYHCVVITYESSTCAQ
jgi:hypothetical protein